MVGRVEGVGGEFRYSLEPPGPAVCQRSSPIGSRPQHKSLLPNKEDVCEQLQNCTLLS